MEQISINEIKEFINSLDKFIDYEGSEQCNELIEALGEASRLLIGVVKNTKNINEWASKPIKSKEINEVYAKDDDMTFILEEIKYKDGSCSTECKGWYYGLPDLDSTNEYYGDLIAFWDEGFWDEGFQDNG